MVKQFHKNNQSSVLRLSQRLEAYQETNSLFEFLVDFSTKSDDEIKETCEKFKEHYFEDIEPEFKDMVKWCTSSRYFISQFDDQITQNSVGIREII